MSIMDQFLAEVAEQQKQYQLRFEEFPDVDVVECKKQKLTATTGMGIYKRKQEITKRKETRSRP